MNLSFLFFAVSFSGGIGVGLVLGYHLLRPSVVQNQADLRAQKEELSVWVERWLKTSERLNSRLDLLKNDVAKVSSKRTFHTSLGTYSVFDWGPRVPRDTVISPTKEELDQWLFCREKRFGGGGRGLCGATTAEYTRGCCRPAGHSGAHNFTKELDPDGEG